MAGFRQQPAQEHGDAGQVTFAWPVRVYYEDTDAGGVVYYANYLRFMERGRTEWLRSLGFEQDLMRLELGLVFVVSETHLKYHRPARFNDLLQVQSRIVTCRPSRLVFGQRVVRDDGEHELLCDGQITVACVEVTTMRPRAVPKSIIVELTGEC